jgi:hypothetical protein
MLPHSAHLAPTWQLRVKLEVMGSARQRKSGHRTIQMSLTLNMKFIVVAWIIGTLSLFAAVQGCTLGRSQIMDIGEIRSCSTCKSWSSTYQIQSPCWCVNQQGIRQPELTCGFCAPNCQSCPSEMVYQFPLKFQESCLSYTEPEINPNFVRLLTYIIITAVSYLINVCAVAWYCRIWNIPSFNYVLAAFIFTWLVWFCLIPAARRSQNLYLSALQTL